MKIEGDTITFTSGRTASAVFGIIGLSQKLDVSVGADEGFDWPPASWTPEAERLTADDMKELAEHMIGLWSKFRDGLTP